MKIDRRSFLAFGIGGAAGTTLSPLPWKLTDDLSIWTQMWPWTPVPTDGEYTRVNSTCTLCPGGCGISVRKVDNRAVKIEGMAGHPVNDGGICLLGLAGLQLLYGPRRIQSPLKRVGERGQGRWAPISWEAAIQEVAGKLEEVRGKGQPQSVAWVSGSQFGTVPALISRFLTAYGSPNFICPPSLQEIYDLTLHLMNGVQGLAGIDAENADFIVSFGSGLIDGWGSPVRMFRVKSKWQESGARLVQVEPRLSNTAAKSDEWVSLQPGTEGALALGLAHVIVSESLYDKEFVENHAHGLKQFQAKVLAKYSPDRVAAITGVDQSTVISLARAFAGAQHPLALSGRGRGLAPGSLGEFMAVHALNALVGNINRKGGVWALPEPDYIDWPEPEMDQTAADGMQQPRVDGAGADKFVHTKFLLTRLAETINGGQGYPLEVLMVHDADPLYTLPDTTAVLKAFEKIPLLVSFSPYLNDTAHFADLILPDHSYLERFQDTPGALGFDKPLLNLVKPVVEPLFKTRHTGDVIIQMARALGGPVAGAFEWESYQACLEETLGDSWDTLVETGFSVDADFKPPAWGSAFETDSRRFDFSAAELKENPFGPVTAEGEKGTYPLLLIGYDTMRLAGGAVGNPPFVTKTVDDTTLKDGDVFVQINPETAGQSGLKEGRPAKLTTPRGEARVRVHLFEGVRPGVVAMPRGLGHLGDNTYLAGKGVNYNQLVGPAEDSASGLDAAWGIRAKLTKA